MRCWGNGSLCGLGPHDPCSIRGHLILCLCGSMIEHLPCKEKVGGLNPSTGLDVGWWSMAEIANLGIRVRFSSISLFLCYFFIINGLLVKWYHTSFATMDFGFDSRTVHKGERVTSFIYSTNISVHSVNGSTLGFQPSSLGSNPNDRI